MTNPKILAIGAWIVLCARWCLAEPPASVKVRFPDYEVKRLGEVDHVSIPGGRLLTGEDGAPVVPFYVYSVSFTAGYRVQEVELTGRTGPVIDSGLKLPTVQPDFGPAARPITTEYPEQEFGWNAVYDGSKALLHIFVYPFIYDPRTTRVRFFNDYEFAIRYAKSSIEITSVTPGQAAYEPGDTVTLTLLTENQGEALDVQLAVSASIPGEDAGGQVAKKQVRLEGRDSLALQWRAAGVEPGVYELEVIATDDEGDELAIGGTTIRIGSPLGEVTGFNVRPKHFKVGDDIELKLDFRNTGTCELEGECVFRVMDPEEQLAEMVLALPKTKPGKTRSFTKTWSSAEAVADEVYTAVGFVRYEGTACEPKTVLFSTNAEPEAVFIVSADSVKIGEAVSFDGTTSTDPDGEIAGFGWEFGDGGEAEGASAAHAYQQAGDFVVRLTVTDSGGRTSTADQTVVVTE
ncbi:MAG: PKD domain-containing protein [candidate division WOR-3 bacterium]|nr:MAG: PKD domain-containing protein [candidate division WOR-3 bacterium]